MIDLLQLLASALLGVLIMFGLPIAAALLLMDRIGE